MAKFNGTTIILNANGTPIAHSLSSSLTIEQDLPDATTKDSSGWGESIHGTRNWSIDVEGLMDYSASFGVDEFADMIVSRQTANIKFTTGTSGDTQYTGTVRLSSLTQEAPAEDVASYSGTLQGDGALTKATVA